MTSARLVRRFGLRHRGPARGDRRRRAPGGDQAQAAAARSAGGFTVDDFTVDEAGRHRDLPGRDHPARSPPATPSSSGPPAAAARCASSAPPPRTAAPCTCTSTTACCAPPARTGPPARTARGLHEAPAQRRTRHRPGRHLARTPAQAPLPRRRPANHAWLKRRTAAINLRTLLGRGLTRRTAPGYWPPDQPARPARDEPAARKDLAASRRATIARLRDCRCRPDPGRAQPNNSPSTTAITLTQKRPNSAGS